MTGSATPLDRLMRWYGSECDGDWEHGFGVAIDTLDNPGWRLKIELTDTKLQGRHFEPVQLGSADETFPEPDMSHWIHCKVEDDVFQGACGPFDLGELIAIFTDWAEPASRPDH